MASSSISDPPAKIPRLESTETPQKAASAIVPQYTLPTTNPATYTKYQQLLSVIANIGKDVRPLYVGNRLSNERIRRELNQARILVRECMQELERDRKRHFSST